MRLCLLLGLVLLFVAPQQSGALQQEEVWNKYLQLSQKQDEQAAPFPGRICGQPSEARKEAFHFAWRYRANAYELHYDDAQALARSVYGLALHAGDIDDSLPVERFIGGVLGFHYSLRQVCDWLNAVVAKQFSSPKLDETVLVGMLLQDGILKMEEGLFVPGGDVAHILAAAPGKKRKFADNLRHERLHVFWDEDDSFRVREQGAWAALSPEQQAEVKKRLSRYASSNTPQLLEEWAIERAEQSNMSLE